MVKMFLIGVFLTALIVRSHGLMSGAPSGACDAMIPGHGGSAQSGSAPYAISFSQNTYDYGSVITVALSKTGNDGFRGFLIQPRFSPDDTASVGAITQGTGMTNKCGASRASVTHSNRDMKDSISFTWTAPSSGSEEDIVFVYTVVGTAKPTYWVKQVSSPLTYQADPTLTTQQTTPSTTVSTTTSSTTTSTITTSTTEATSATSTSSTTTGTTLATQTTVSPSTTTTISMTSTTETTQTTQSTSSTSTQTSSTQSTSTEPSTIPVSLRLDAACGVTRSCMHDCSAVSGECNFLVSWLDLGDSTVEFTLNRKLTGDSWMAVGFSDDKRMGDDSVAECWSVGGQVSAKASYNLPNTKANQQLDPSGFGVTLTASSHANGVFSCTFTRAKTATLAGDVSKANQFFDIDNTDWYLLVAYGVYSSSAAYTGKIKHTETPVASDGTAKIDFQTIRTTSAPTTSTSTTPGTPTGTGKITKDEACGDTKGCFHDCAGSGECKFLDTWAANGDVIDFTMRYKTGSTADWYTAMGLSTDSSMGDDHVIECIASGGNVNAYVSYNYDGYNERFSDRTLGITPVGASYTDGVLECSFSHAKTFDIATASGSRRKRAVTADANNYYDLTKRWTLLHAHGTVDATGFKVRHDDSPVVSTEKADFLDFQDLGATTVTDVMVKVHGILMVLAWVCYSSIGVVIARYYKLSWSEKSSLCGEKVWFQLHRCCMITVFCCVVAAFVVIFVHVGGYSKISGDNFSKAHPIMGIVSTAFCVINPIMAAFRPHPGTPRRPIFRAAHALVAMVAVVVATVNIFAGVGIKSANLPEYVRYPLYAWVAWQGVFETFSWVYDCCTKNRSKGEAYEMSDREGNPSDSKSNYDKGQPVKRFAIFLHAIVVAGLAIAVSVIIGMN